MRIKKIKRLLSSSMFEETVKSVLEDLNNCLSQSFETDIVIAVFNFINFIFHTEKKLSGNKAGI